jgi:NTP pyrophosphatase (non-canonical NTP hydrolase)
MTLNQLARTAHLAATEKGFYANGRKEDFGNLLMQATREITEAFEADRADAHCLPNWIAEWRAHGAGKLEFESVINNTVEDELADAIIILAGIAGYMGMDLELHVAAKMEYNKGRKRLHGRVR